MIKSSWPSQIRSVYGDHQRCIDTYYSMYPGYYTTGDGARRDEEKARAKEKATESQVRRGTPLVQYIQAPQEPKAPDLTTERLGKGESLAQTQRKKRTRLMGRGRARGRRSLLTSTGMGYYGGRV